MIAVVCPNCSRSLKVPESAAGKRGKCPGCSSAVDVPEPVAAVAADAFADILAQAPPPLPLAQDSEPVEPGPAFTDDEEKPFPIASRVARASGWRGRGNNWLPTGLLAGILVMQIVPYLTSSAPPAPAQWEYVILSPPDDLLEARLKEAGEKGWELVTARRATSSLTDRVSY